MSRVYFIIFKVGVKIAEDAQLHGTDRSFKFAHWSGFRSVPPPPVAAR